MLPHWGSSSRRSTVLSRKLTPGQQVRALTPQRLSSCRVKPLECQLFNTHWHDSFWGRTRTYHVLRREAYDLTNECVDASGVLDLTSIISHNLYWFTTVPLLLAILTQVPTNFLFVCLFATPFSHPHPPSLPPPRPAYWKNISHCLRWSGCESC